MSYLASLKDFGEDLEDLCSPGSVFSETGQIYLRRAQSGLQVDIAS